MRNLNRIQYTFGIFCIFALALSAFAQDIHEANRYFLTQKYDAAIEKYQQALNKADDEEAGYLHFYIGRSYEMKNWWKKAMDHFEIIKDKYPEHPLIGETMLEIGQCHVRLQKIEEALKIFEETSLNFEDPYLQASSLYNKAMLQCYSNKNVFDLDAAIKSFHRIISDYKISDLRVKSYYWLGLCLYRQKEYEKAIEAWEHVTEEGPETLWADFVPVYIQKAHAGLGGTKNMQKFIQQNLSQRVRTDQFNRAFEIKPRKSDKEDGFHFVELGPDKMRKGVFLYKIYSVKDKTLIYTYFVETNRLDWPEKGNVISLNGQVRITDRRDNPSIELTASNIDIHLDQERARCNGNINFLRNDVTTNHKDQSMRNQENLEFELRTKKVRIK